MRSDFQHLTLNKANVRDLIVATGLVILLKVLFKSSIFQPVTLNLMDDLEKTIGHYFYTKSSFVHHFKAIGECKLELQSGNTQFGKKLAILNMTDDLEKQ